MGSFPQDDFNMLVHEAQAVGAKSALEFGPGGSTMAFVEAGCTRVLTLEHDPLWLYIAMKRFEDIPQIEVGTYANTPIVSIAPEAAASETFDVAFVDSPVGNAHRRVRFPGQEDCARLNTVLFALERAPVVMLHDAHRPGEQATLQRVADMGLTVHMHEAPCRIARITRQPR